uniref:G-protein coupled receptors family 1 profile domain-containing protein n=1 Tax=Ditylenchus dipsaci TaxID=166011 RepID=A0A915CSZ9_9BILA
MELNSTITNDKQALSVFLRIIAVLTIGSVTLVGLIANVIVVLAIAGDRKMRKSSMNLLLFNLAVADFLALVTYTVIWFPSAFYGTPAWMLPVSFCPIDKYLNVTTLAVSQFTYIAICVERYIAIVHPMQAKSLISGKRILCALTFIWIFALFLQLIYYIGWTYPQYISKNVADIKHNTDHCVDPIFYEYGFLIWVWIDFDLFVVYILPGLLSVILYQRICATLSTRAKLLQESPKKKRDYDADRLHSFFYICYTPWTVYMMWGATVNTNFKLPFKVWMTVALIMQICNTANPFVYTLYSVTLEGGSKICSHVVQSHKYKICLFKQEDLPIMKSIFRVPC